MNDRYFKWFGELCNQEYAGSTTKLSKNIDANKEVC